MPDLLSQAKDLESFKVPTKKTHPREYWIWKGICQRCLNKSHPLYSRYGGRGIRVCVRWYKSFVTFMSDMGPRPSLLHSVDRKKNDGPYSPSNCRWATKKQQSRNRGNNRLITFGGQTKCVSEWAEELNMSHQLLRQRIAEWGVERAMTVRKRENEKLVTFRGKTQSLAQWADELGISRPSLYWRVAHHGAEKALSLPARDLRKVKNA